MLPVTCKWGYRYTKASAAGAENKSEFYSYMKFQQQPPGHRKLHLVLVSQNHTCGCGLDAQSRTRAKDQVRMYPQEQVIGAKRGPAGSLSHVHAGRGPSLGPW